MSEEVERLGNWIAAANRRWRWSRKTTTNRTGVGERTLWAIENGQRNSLQDETIDGISRGYDIDRATIVKIMRGEDVPIPADPPDGAGNATDPSLSEFEVERIWDELTDLRRRIVELDERTKIRVSQLADRLERLAPPGD